MQDGDDKQTTKWQATVRRDGKSRSMTFIKRADALKWSRDAGMRADRGELHQPKHDDRLTTASGGDLIDKCQSKVALGSGQSFATLCMNVRFTYLSIILSGDLLFDCRYSTIL